MSIERLVRSLDHFWVRRESQVVVCAKVKDRLGGRRRNSYVARLSACDHSFTLVCTSLTHSVKIPIHVRIQLCASRAGKSK